MKASFYKNLEAYKANLSRSAPINKEISPRGNLPHSVNTNSSTSIQKEVETLQKIVNQEREKLTTVQNNYNSTMHQLNYAKEEIAQLKSLNQQLNQTIQSKDMEINQLKERLHTLESQDQSRVKELEAALIERDKDLSSKEGMIKGLKESIQVISSLNLNKLSLNQTMDNQNFGTANNQPDNLQNLLDNLNDVNDIDTVQSQIVGNNNISELTPHDSNNSFSIQDSNH